MKKRILSLLLTLTTLLSLFPAWSLNVKASAQGMTEAEAFDAGLDVFVAWYNHSLSYDGAVIDSIQNIYKDPYSAFNQLYGRLYPDGPDSESTQKTLNAAEDWIEDKYDGVGQYELAKNEVIMALLLSCVLYTGKASSSEDNDVTDMEKLVEDTVKTGYSIYTSDTMKDLYKFATSSNKKIDIDYTHLDMPELTSLGDYSFGIITSILMGGIDEQKNRKTAIENAAKYDTIGSASARDIDILRRHSDDMFLGDYIDLYVEAYDKIWETGSSDFEEMLLEEYGNWTDTFIDVLNASIEAGLGLVVAEAGSASALGFISGVTAAGLVGFELFNIIEGVWKLGGDALFGQNAMRTADITLYYLQYIRSVFYSGYLEAYEAFFFDPTPENARLLNTYSRLMYRIFAASEMYASQLNNTYSEAGAFNFGWTDYIPGGVDPTLTELGAIQSSRHVGFREQYLTDAYDRYLKFCDENVYNIFLNMNGGTFPVAEQLGFYESRIPIQKIYSLDAAVPSGIPYREGYKFLGWTDVKGGTVPNPTYAPGSIYRKEADIELYAVWQKQLYVSYNANGGTGAPISHENTGNTIISSEIPKREGFDFLGWSESPGATQATYVYSDSAKNRITKSENVTLYAVWKPKVFDIVFNANGGAYADTSTSVTKKKTYLQSFTIDFEAPTWDEHEFLGWSQTEGGSVQYKHAGVGGASVSDATYYDIGGKGAVTKNLYAVWAKTKASFTYDYGDSTASAPVTVPLSGGKGQITLSAPDVGKIEEMGRDFLRWRYYLPNGSCEFYYPGDVITISDDTIVYAEWEDPSALPQLSILTDKNSYNPGETAYISITAENSGFFLADASENSSFKLKNAAGSKAQSGYFVENSSSSAYDELKCYDNGSAYILELYIPSTCPDGVYYVDITAYLGTYGASSATDFSASEAVPIKIYTAAEEKASYILSYSLNGGSGTVPSSEFFEEYEYVVLSDDSRFEREGYEFAGWCEESDGSGKIYKADSEYQFSDSLILYAVWEPIEGYGDLDIALMVERYSNVYKPGETAHVFVYPHYSNHFYFDVSSCSGFTIRNSAGDKVTGDTWIEKSSPNYDPALEGYNDNGMIAIYIYIPKDCPDGQYTFYCTASNGLLKEDNTSDGDKMRKSVTINVRESEDADAVHLSKTEMTLHVGDEKRLTASIEPAFFTDKEVSWSISSGGIISIEKKTNRAYISGVKSGTATVTATVDGVSESCTVKVVKCDYTEKIISDEYLASSASCSGAARYYYVCSCGDVSAETYSYGSPLSHVFSDWSITREAGEFEAGQRQRSCSECSFCEIEAIPATGHNEHSALSLWFSDDSGHWKECCCGYSFDAGEHEDEGGDNVCDICSATLMGASALGIDIDITEATIAEGEILLLSAKVFPANAINKSIVWSTSDGDVLSVSDGVVSAVGAGSATVTATTADGGFSVSCHITVKSEEEMLEDAFTFALATLEAEAGDTVEMRLKIANGQSFSSAAFELEYDRSALTLTGYRCDYDWQPVTSFDEDTEAYPVTFSYEGEYPEYEGTVLLLTFKVNADAVGGNHKVTLSPIGSVLDSEGNEIPCRFTGGGIILPGATPGDSNSDGTVNTKDAVLLAQHLAGWHVTIDADAADCNKDGDVNTKDAVLLAQHLAGWSVTLR